MFEQVYAFFHMINPLPNCPVSPSIYRAPAIRDDALCNMALPVAAVQAQIPNYSHLYRHKKKSSLFPLFQELGHVVTAQPSTCSHGDPSTSEGSQKLPGPFVSMGVSWALCCHHLVKPLPHSNTILYSKAALVLVDEGSDCYQPHHLL